MSTSWWLLAALAVALLGWWRAHTRIRRSNQRRFRRAMAGEAAADQLLEQAGFRVLDHQVTAHFPLWIDGEEVWVHDRCDRIVTRDGHLYVADVKTGRAADPTAPSTRRQLLEYLLVHRATGALVVDMDAGRVIEVDFGDLLDDG